MKQTAVEWLVEQVNKSNLGLTSAGQALLVELAKEMEMKQIMDAYIKGHIESSWGRFADSEQYYNETFKSE